MVLNTNKPNKADNGLLRHNDTEPTSRRQTQGVQPDTGIRQATHNTLRHHLDSLIGQKVVTRSQRTAEGRGRPRFTYSAKVGVGKVFGSLPSPSTGVVSLTFEKLSQVCRFEKGEF